MKRATITIPDDLERELDHFLANQETPPSLTNIVQTALRSYLEQRKLSKYGYCAPTTGPMVIVTAESGSGKKNIARDHNQYFSNVWRQ